MKLAASIKEVAKLSGVSAGTVSRAFNNYPDIKPETRERILRIAKEVGYSPTLSAKNLSSKKSSGMALILSQLLSERIGGRESDGRVFMQRTTEDSSFLIMCGACRYAIERNLDMPVYVYSSELQNRKTYEQFCREHRLGGALLFGLQTTDNYYKALSESTLPCVTVDTRVLGENVGYVGTDNIESFRMLTEYLLDAGHREIVVLNGRKVATVCLERLAGVYEAYSAREMQLRSEDVLYTDFREDLTEKVVTNYLGKYGKSRATAFLCMSDLIAITAIRTIQKRGFSVPDDFSVVGYDGMASGRFIYPGLTTIDQDLESKGYAAARLLNRMMNGQVEEKEVLLPYHLVERGSVAPPWNRDCAKGHDLAEHESIMTPWSREYAEEC